MHSKIVILLLFGIALCLLVASFFVFKWKTSLQPQPIQSRIVPTPPPVLLYPSAATSALKFSLDPRSSTVQIGQSITVNILINIDKQANGVDLFFRFDPKRLSLQNVSPGSYFTNPIVIAPKKLLSDGTTFYSLASTTKATGKGTLAMLKFTALAAGTTSVTLDTRTLVAVNGATGVNLSSPITGTYTIIK